MAAKKERRTKPMATFEVRFVAKDVMPEKIPLHTVNDALSAVQDLASGRDPFEERCVRPEKAIGLLDVRRGSAVYRCISHAPEEALTNLARVGTLLTSLDKSDGEGEELIPALRPIQTLSEVATSIGCRVQVRIAGQRPPLFCVDKDDYQRLSERLLVRGETTIFGKVERVGGATEMRCLLRVSGRRRGLYCNVKGRDVARELGRHLYEHIAATGTATRIHRSWRIHSFEVTGFTQPCFGSVPKVIEGLRDAGLSAWDQIDDPEKYMRELRE